MDRTILFTKRWSEGIQVVWVICKYLKRADLVKIRLVNSSYFKKVQKTRTRYFFQIPFPNFSASLAHLLSVHFLFLEYRNSLSKNRQTLYQVISKLTSTNVLHRPTYYFPYALGFFCSSSETFSYLR